MRRISGRTALTVVSVVCVLILAACNCAPILRFLTVSPTSATINATTTQQFSARFYYSDGTTTDATGTVQWSSSNPAVASIGPGGVAVANSAGTTTITATSGALVASGTLNVNQLESIAVTPGTANTFPGGTATFTAMGTFLNSDGSPSTTDITSQVTWASSDQTVATMSGNVATGVANGTTQITASLYGVVSPAATLTVGGAGPLSLQITPANPTIAVGNSATFTAVELWSDSTLHTPPAGTQIDWTSGTPATATLANSSSTTSNTNIAAALAAGTTVITATEHGTTLTGNTTLTVVTGTAHYAYIANNGDPSVGEFTVNAAAAVPLTGIGTVTQAPNPLQTFLHPSGKYLYSVDDVSAVWVYDVNASTGALTFTGATPIPAGSGGTNFGAVEPFGRFLYVIDTTTTSIYGFTINPADGTLTLIPGAPFSFPSSLNQPQGIVVDHTGQFVYVTNFASGMVSAYSIDQTTGVLTELSPATISSGTGPEYPAIDPTGKYLYVPNNSDNTVSAYSIGANGQLTSLGADTAITGSLALINLVVDPSGKYLYVLDAGTTGNGQVFAYNLNSDGTIGTAIGSALPAGAGPTGIAVDPTGVLLAVDNSFDGTISLFTITAGTLAAESPATVNTGTTSPDSNPFFVIFYDAP